MYRIIIAGDIVMTSHPATVNQNLAKVWERWETVPILKLACGLDLSFTLEVGRIFKYFSIFECWLTCYMKCTFAYSNIRYMYRICYY